MYSISEHNSSNHMITLDLITIWLKKQKYVLMVELFWMFVLIFDYCSFLNVYFNYSQIGVQRWLRYRTFLLDSKKKQLK